MLAVKLKGYIQKGALKLEPIEIDFISDSATAGTVNFVNSLNLLN